MADSKLNESPEMVLLIYRNLFFPNHTIIKKLMKQEENIQFLEKQFFSFSNCQATVIGEF